MVTVGESIREVKHSGSHLVHRMETGFVAVYDWLTGPAMSDQERLRRSIAETEPVRRLGGIEY